VFFKLQIDAMSASIRQLEMERDNVVSQLRESNLLQQALRDKLDNVQLDLASQGTRVYICLKPVRSKRARNSQISFVNQAWRNRLCEIN